MPLAGSIAGICDTAKDSFHQTVKDALEDAGWEILYDPLRIAIGQRQAFIDLGARNLIAAHKEGSEIAVEIKSFLSPSLLEDLYGAIGQYQLYRLALQRRVPVTDLFLALPNSAWKLIVEDQIELYLKELQIKVIVFDPKTNQIDQWIS